MYSELVLDWVDNILDSLTDYILITGGHMEDFQVEGAGRPCCEDKFYMGFKECQDEVMRYYVEFEGRDIKDPVCVNISKHLEQISLKFLRNGTWIYSYDQVRWRYIT